MNVNTIKYSGQSVYEEMVILVFGLCTGNQVPNHLVLSIMVFKMGAFNTAQLFCVWKPHEVNPHAYVSTDAGLANSRMLQ